MHILFLSHYFPPEVNAPASRTFEHCKQWQQAEHKVTVVTCAPNHPAGVVYDGYRNRLFQRQQVEGIEVIRLWTFVSANEGFAKRSLNYISYMLMCIFCCFRFGKADILVSTSPQFFNGLAGYFVSRLKRIPWVLEIRDLWPDSILAVGATDNQLIINTLYKLEKFVYRQCDKLVVVTDAFKRHIADLGVSADKIEVIKNGVDLTAFDAEKDYQTQDLEALIGYSKAELEDKLVCAYVGTHGMAHHLETVIQAATQLQHDSSVLFLMVGDGAEKQKLLQQKQELGLNNLIMLDQLPKAKMPALWSLIDVSLILLRKDDLFKTVIPSKIFESLAMAKPIVLGVEGEAAELVKASKAGEAIVPEDASALVSIVKNWQQNPSELQRLQESGPTFVAQNFNRISLAQRFLNLMLDLVPDARNIESQGSSKTIGGRNVV